MNFHTYKPSNLLPFPHFNIIKRHTTQFTDYNTKTVRVYNDEYQHYLENTPSKHPNSYSPMLDWIKNSLDRIPTGGKVLEIGSATPRDANFMRHLGYYVQCSDAAANFVNHMNQHGENAILLNVLKDRIPTKYDMIFANAVFPHFSDSEIISALSNMEAALNPDGIVVFNVKQGDGETWIEEKNLSKRYTNYQRPDNIKRLVNASGLRIVHFEDGCIGDPPTHIWTRVTAQKIS